MPLMTFLLASTTLFNTYDLTKTLLRSFIPPKNSHRFACCTQVKLSYVLPLDSSCR